MLNVDCISKTYNKQAIFSNLSFSVHPGEIIGLVGENGAGKSTLLQLLATLQSPTTGGIQLYDWYYKQHRKLVRRHIGFVPQEIAIWDNFTVRENMIFFEKLAWKKKSEKELKQLCLDMNLDRWDEKVHTLSGGMKRKLNLAISLIHDPDLILLDEPTVGIDLKSKKEIAAYLKKLAQEKEKMILYTSHDMDEINELCTRVICIGKDPFYKNLLQHAGKKIISF
ncbi:MULTISPECIES: ABC transporter ATP-binding protein [Virgibacillus]|uniref:ABC transporter ATP-binding protein n=1 Tax=Virgibacillus pantothenticus TaxID=1473 RepID=A0A0L0QQA2_VIRPA|nr:MULTISPECIES: ABC transporter ATP-binding protein [Virgibacillus]API90797.1 ABC transporter ATP-binding protein [Virgibacillus sp. 6R]KNE20744.1 ABC transporter ATP-binding protein [Virgibacillus pantothenticus]MBS7426773.1 ABC transporter ATP-binding protein [Virgibacillus sp. 19R1-5]MBU8566100.1 ABC transporter ATP-binding protein [Virgibacillus pantothenticus]MBU8600604.1 ABC transporter ATP-binding protein [Virgibacillus pantothenticus]